jgi:BirA family transcriptional regulator, biotin operon repressor / biotin---[acetyl-CoA-carboxylase] ligase
MTNFLASLALLERHCDELVVLAEISSTNDYLRESFVGPAGVRIAVTDTQTSGRGRLQRTWVTKPGESLAMSVELPWSFQPQDAAWSWLSLVAGASLTRALRAEGFSGVTLKWPNDVLVGEKKLAGILCESLPGAAVIVGVGINVHFPEDAPPSPKATALSHHSELAVDLVDRAVSRFVASLKEFVALEGEEAAVFAKTFVTEVLGTLGRRVSVVAPDSAEWSGQAVGLDEFGHLLVTPEGSTTPQVVVASDIGHLYQ